MNCEELKARLTSQKAALLRLQAQEMAFFASQFPPSGSLSNADDIGTRTRVSDAYPEYFAAKSAYDSASRRYAQALRG